ncbi:MAG: LysR family transcriptional regulator [Burkholderiaceae bacterium]|jgi:LysR family tcuABC transcriptional regulator|nr:LysR family transcriptional regulator [Burkholderiaceae bacterium]
MDIRQLRYFVKVCEAGGISRAALELELAPSALSQQIGRLEGELATRLLRRQSTGVTPTDAGIALLQQAQLILRHMDAAVRAAQGARLAGEVRVGLPSTTAAALGVPLARAMRERYPAVRLHLVEALSGHLAQMLNTRQIDLAIVFRADAARRWSVTPLLDERLYVIGAPDLPALPRGKSVRLRALAEAPLILPSPPHGLRAHLDAAFERLRVVPRVVAEVDGLALLMDMVRAGLGVTIQPSAATARLRPGEWRAVPLADPHTMRRNLLVSLPEDELSPAALAARVVLTSVARQAVREGWLGVRTC